jgi:hypothetical protein
LAAVVTEVGLGGGPALAVVFGGLASVAVQGGHLLMARLGETFGRNSGRALEVALDHYEVGLDILWEDRIEGHDDRVALLARVIEASARSSFEDKIDALGRALRDGLRDDGDAGEALILASAISVVERQHLRLLQYLDRHPRPPVDLLPASVSRAAGWPVDALEAAVPELSVVLDGLLAVLAGQGLLRDAATSYSSAPGPVLWQITELGRRCLFLFD